MSFIYSILHKKQGDNCPACYSTDIKTPKGKLIKNGKSWGLKCSVCKYKQIFKTDNSSRSRKFRRK